MPAPNTTVLLTPRMLDTLRNLELVARAMVEGTLTGLHRSPYHGFSSEFSEYRKYCPGDAVKHVDWVAYAKTDRYYVKQYEDETNTRAYVVLDRSGSMALGSAKAHKFHYACYLAAAFIYLMQRQKDAVGLFSYSDRITSYFPAKGSRLHMLSLLAHLETLVPEGRSDAGPCFHRIAEEIHRRSIVLIFSDFFDPNPSFINSLRQFQHKNCEVLLFQILDPMETQFPFRGLIEFRDMETGEALEVESEDCRETYLSDLGRHIRDMKRTCGRMNMGFETLSTGTPFDRALLAYFHKRERMF
ncbi:MAG TPA: DUF58 domain-containing protein [Kiritimatiellia bacterium]|nr:DUF58 domain-containing protein [Kiritimatiellia bacterium]HPS06707.1 DUF58 domain-containing protein [Kiritimatiellia bacterium]